MGWNFQQENNLHSLGAELHFGWGYAVVETMTHDTNSITDLDFQLALEINRLEVP